MSTQVLVSIYKPSGKLYTEGNYTTEKTTLEEIKVELAAMQKEGKLPGLIEGGDQMEFTFEAIISLAGLGHSFYEFDDVKDTDPNGFLYLNVVDGGLAICKVCGLMEGSLTTHCPGEMSISKHEEIYAGNLDYRADGGWVMEKNPINKLWERNQKIKQD